MQASARALSRRLAWRQTTRGGACCADDAGSACSERFRKRPHIIVGSQCNIFEENSVRRLNVLTAVPAQRVSRISDPGRKGLSTLGRLATHSASPVRLTGNACSTWLMSAPLFFSLRRVSAKPRRASHKAAAKISRSFRAASPRCPSSYSPFSSLVDGASPW